MFRDYWGKARAGQPNPWHPLAYHSLDVGACAAALLEVRPDIVSTLAQLSGAWSPDEAQGVAVLMALLHDQGKFARSFQSLSRETCGLLGSLWVDGLPYDRNGCTGHDSLGAWVWGPGGVAASLLDVDDPFEVAAAIRLLGAPAFGHHGVPPREQGLPRRPDRTTRRLMPDTDLAAARAFALACAGLLGAGKIRLPANEDASRRVSLPLAALINVADWLGSSVIWFPYRAPDLPLADYWRDEAMPAARRAVREAGLVPAPPRAMGSFASLYPGWTPTPLQSLVDGIKLPGQFLVLIEETPGGGKTEAAMTVAARVVARGTSCGVFFGLPTTTTADAQAKRQAEVYRLLFDGGDPSLTLAHSRAGGLFLAGADCAAWISDDRRRRLMASVCVGTVDQALLAALPARFNALRVFGLLGKLLVLDEIHSFDGYTSRLLEALLALHASLGGSAVLLSATLGSREKKRMLDAFTQAASMSPVPPDVLADPRYPLVTVVGPQGCVVDAPAPHPGVASDKPLSFVRSVAEAQRAVLDAARAGLCVAWIRNTVDQAVETGVVLRERHDDVMVFHSRFPEADLEDRRAEVLSRFGKDGDPSRRAGGVVVATSIIEQSLDLDFDLVVVDLKPVDSVIQALGRARRHVRDASGRRIDGIIDGRPPMSMVVVAPDPDDVRGAGWYGSLLGNAQFIHQDAGVLWRTAAALERAGTVRYGSETRKLVEDALSEESDLPVPECLEETSLRAQGTELADRASAQLLASRTGPGTGYVHVAESWDDTKVPTRLGESVELILVRQEGGVPVPYRGTSWHSGRLRVSVSSLRSGDETSRALAERLKKQVPYSVATLVDEECIHDGNRVRAFAVSRDTGLRWTGAARKGEKVE